MRAAWVHLKEGRFQQPHFDRLSALDDLGDADSAFFLPQEQTIDTAGLSYAPALD